MIVIDEAQVLAGLPMDACIEAVRAAMIALSAGLTRQLPRTMIAMGEGRIFGQMPGALALDGYFGAKLVSVFADPERPGRTSHQGVVVLFEPEGGAPVCVADAQAITQIRTAAATAVATDALARQDASSLAVIGAGHQASAHIEAIAQVRTLSRVVVWGRSFERAAAFAERMSERFGLEVSAAPTVREAVAGADMVCTVSAAVEPILMGDWVADGTHVSLVGSSGPQTSEVDHAMVARGRYFVESRDSAHRAAAEFLRAREAGIVGDDHIVGEIGEVLAGTVPGRTSDAAVTIYKSIGHAVQDLAACAYLYEQARGARG